MTDERYEALYERLQRLNTSLQADFHATAIQGVLQLCAVLLDEIQRMQQLLDVLTQGLSDVVMERLTLQRRVALLETPYGGRPGRGA
jgi:hypothetical protein